MLIIKTLVVLILAYLAGFYLLKNLTQQVMDARSFQLLKTTWMQLTIVAFIAQYFWLMCVFATIIILRARKKLENITTLFALLLFVIPSGGKNIAGVGGINYFLTFDFPKLLTLILLLPIAISIFRKSFGKLPSILPERFFYIFIIINLVVLISAGNFTNFLRVLTTSFLDFVVPFYVFTHLYHSKNKIKELILILVSVSILFSIVGIIEYIKHWPLYSIVLDFDTVNQFFVTRGGFSLRSIATTQQPIVLGFLISIGFCLFFAIKDIYFKNKFAQYTAIILMILGMLSTLSRGPWLGAIFMLILLQLLNRNSLINFFKLTIILFTMLGALSFTNYGQKLINMLPGIGGSESGWLDYRTLLVQNSLKVAGRHPWFGSVDYIDQPEMQVLTQGQGIVDITNTYLQVLLEHGYVGLSMFSLVFITTLIALYKSLRNAQSDEISAIGKGLFTALMGVVLMIADVSSITFVPWIYWILIGVSISYIQFVKLQSISNTVYGLSKR